MTLQSRTRFDLISAINTLVFFSGRTIVAGSEVAKNGVDAGGCSNNHLKTTFQSDHSLRVTVKSLNSSASTADAIAPVVRKASLKLKVRWECFGNLADATWRLKRKKREEEVEKKKRVTVVKWGLWGS